MNRRSAIKTLMLLAGGSALHGQKAKASRFPVQFEDVARQAGLRAPTIYGGASGNRYILETTGCGAAFIDFDNDGWIDIFLINGTTLEAGESGPTTNRLYKNNRDGTFTDVTKRAGLERCGWGQGVCVGDYNNDGNDDLFVTYWGHNVLYRNNGDGTFTDVTAAAGLAIPEVSWGSGCAFLDYDGDGYLDLFVTNYLEFDPKTAPLPGSELTCTYQGYPVNCGPHGLPRGSSRLYRNNRDGTFSNLTAASGIGKALTSYGLGVLVGDFDNDGRPDIFVANDSDPSYLFWNNGDGTFTEGGMEAGVATDEEGRYQSGMGAACGDYDCDGLLDIFKTNFSDDLPNLYRNLGKREFKEMTQSANLGGNSRLLGWGCGFLDIDNDGWLDILYVNGHVYPEISRIQNAIKYKQPKVVYQNLGNGKFQDVSHLVGDAISEETSSRGCAFGDFNNDGNVDVLINPINGLPQLLRCSSETANNWITIKLVGTKSNRSAIGARVRCTTGPHQQIAEVRSGGSFFSQDDLRVHFGVGKTKQIDRLEIRWPSGANEALSNVPTNQIIKIVEGRAGHS